MSNYIGGLDYLDEYKKQIAQASNPSPSFVEAMKDDKDKVRWDLLPVGALEEVAQVLTHGAKKYEAWNWAKDGGFTWSRLIRAGIGHLFAFARGVDKDEETGYSHLAHAICCLLFLLTYARDKTKYTKDDRRET